MKTTTECCWLRAVYKAMIRNIETYSNQNDNEICLQLVDRQHLKIVINLHIQKSSWILTTLADHGGNYCKFLS